MDPRLIQLHPKTYQRLERLQTEAERDGAYRVAKRIHAVLLNADGHTSGYIAELLKTPRSKTSEWLAHYERHGEESLLEGHRTGRPPLLSENQRAGLSDIIESGPVAYGLDAGVWTSPMIVRVIEEEYGVRFHPGHVRKLLAVLGFSVQRPRRLLARADAVAQARWRRYTYPNIKKKPKRRGEPLSSQMRPASGRIPPSMPRGRGLDTNHKFP